MTSDISAIRLVHKPLAWAFPPECMSFSKLRQIEACPRRWSLMASDYPQIWSKRGYPDPLVPSNIIGSVTHRAVEIIVKEFRRNGCTSLTDVEAVKVMRGMGGFSVVIGKCTEDVLLKYADNPRAVKHLENARRYAQASTPEIRENVKLLLARILNGPRSTLRDISLRRGNEFPMKEGIYPEVRLINETIKWEGVADVVALSSTDCEIRDIKTGVPKEEHAEQLRIYNLLWLMDAKRNPSGRPASKLTLSYLHGDVAVPPLVGVEIGAFREELVERTRDALKWLLSCPPKAMPSTENCRHCFVKHLCDTYWQKSTMDMLGKNTDKNSLLDMEVRITGKHGSKSFDAASVMSSAIVPDVTLLIRVAANSGDYRVGDYVRLIDVSMTKQENDKGDNEVLVVNMLRSSEAFIRL